MSGVTILFDVCAASVTAGFTGAAGFSVVFVVVGRGFVLRTTATEEEREDEETVAAAEEEDD